MSRYILPQELSKPPIEEAVFDLRVSAPPVDLVERISTAMRTRPGSDDWRVGMPTVPDPAAVGGRRATDPGFAPAVRMAANDVTLFLAPSAVAVRIGAPYPGWERFRVRVDAVLDVLSAEQLAPRVDRIGLRFVNILRDVPAKQLEALHVEIRIAGEAAAERGLTLHAELSDEIYERTIEVRPGVGSVSGDPGSALLLALGVRRGLQGVDFWAKRGDMLENLHFELRALFFRLLTPDAVQRHGPIYRQVPEP